MQLPWRNMYAVLLTIVGLSLSAHGQASKPILVLLHGIGDTPDSLKTAAKSLWDQESFSKVVIAKCNWKAELIPIAGPRIYRSLEIRYPGSQFILFGYDEGGLIAEWIAKRVKASNGRITRVVTVNTPLDGLLYSDQDLLKAPRVRDLQPNSPTIRDLGGPPINDVRSVEFVRVWENGNTKVTKESAFRSPAAGIEAYHVVVRTKAANSQDQLPGLLLQAREHYLSSNWSGAIEVLRQAVVLSPNDKEVNFLLGDCYFKLGSQNRDQAQGTQAFRLATQYLQKAISLGREATLPVRHQRVAVFAADRYFCRGSITIARASVHLVSMCDTSHDFEIPPQNLSNILFDFQSAHLSFSIPGGGRKKKPRSYDLFPAAIGIEESGLRQAKRSFTISDPKLTPGASGAIEVVYNLLLAAQSH